MSITNFVQPARFAGAWLVLAGLTTTFGLQLSAQLRQFRTENNWLHSSVSKRPRRSRDAKMKTPVNCHRNNHGNFESQAEMRSDCYEKIVRCGGDTLCFSVPVGVRGLLGPRPVRTRVNVGALFRPAHRRRRWYALLSRIPVAQPRDRGCWLRLPDSPAMAAADCPDHRGGGLACVRRNGLVRCPWRGNPICGTRFDVRGHQPCLGSPVAPRP